MEIKFLDFPLKLDGSELPPLSMALGYFDGVHLGHQKVISEAKKYAVENSLSSAVMTFDPHPSVVLGKAAKRVRYITMLPQKIKLIEDLGIDYLFIVQFTSEFASLLPQEFIDQYVIGLNVKHVTAGFDFTYGRMGKGTMETLPFHSRDQFSYTVVPKLSKDGEKVSSTRIRGLILEGRVDELPDLLGRFYTTVGKVVHGEKRGRAIGFPTANVEVGEEAILPPLGVYAVRMKVDNTWFNGVCNLGIKPTFHETPIKPSAEVHLFHFEDNIYGKQTEIEWHLFLRKEQKFSGIEELTAQIDKDKQQTLDYFRYNCQKSTL